MITTLCVVKMHACVLLVKLLESIRNINTLQRPSLPKDTYTQKRVLYALLRVVEDVERSFLHSILGEQRPSGTSHVVFDKSKHDLI